MLRTLRARRLITPNRTFEYPTLILDNGSVLEVQPGEANGETEVLTSPFFDIHVHGAMTYDFMTADAPEIDAVGRFLATRGVGQYLPTTITGALDVTFRALTRLGSSVKAATPRDAATPLGIALEGPFLCPAKRGVHPPDRILAPSIGLFDRFQAAADGQIRLMTLAPEMPGALELIHHATARGVRVSLGHSNATGAETLAAIAAGATSATHTFNAMRPLDHREPGLAGTVLDQDALFAEAIVDGIHIHPAMVRLWFRMKGDRRAILITDGMSATGMPDGTYMLGELVVEVRDGVCLSGGALAGSVLTMDGAVANLREITGAPLESAVRLASGNPAAMLGLADLFDVTPGSAASFNIYDEDGKRLGSMLHGVRLP